MSYLGSVGFIIENSGLKDLFCEAYAPDTINRMLKGHEYARSSRAHLLAHLALSKIIVPQIILNEEGNTFLSGLICVRREFLREILYKNIAIITIQHSNMYFVDTSGDFSHTVG